VFGGFSSNASRKTYGKLNHSPATQTGSFTPSEIPNFRRRVDSSIIMATPALEKPNKYGLFQIATRIPRRLLRRLPSPPVCSEMCGFCGVKDGKSVKKYRVGQEAQPVLYEGLVRFHRPQPLVQPARFQIVGPRPSRLRTIAPCNNRSLPIVRSADKR